MYLKKLWIFKNMSMQKKLCLVGHECGYYKGQGGIATYIEHTAKGFSKLGYDVHVIFLHGSELDVPGITSWKIKDQLSIFKNSKAIDEVLEKIKPDVVESTDFLGLVSYTLSKRARVGLSYNCKFINNNHTAIREVWEWGTNLDFFGCCPNWMAEIHQYERAQAILSDANFSTSTFLSNYLSSQYETTVQTCPSYYELKKNIDDRNNHYSSTSLKILSLGRFELRKKQELLIKASCKLIKEGYDLHVTLIGNSGDNFYNRKDYMDSCYSLIPISMKKNFSFFDFMPYKELQKHYQDYDLFVIPSPYENFPNTALEAISYGVAVAGSLTSGIADMVGPTANDMCFEKNSVSSMKQVILNYYGMSQEERSRVRQSQRESLDALVSFDNAIVKRIKMYEDVPAKSHEKTVLPEKCLIITKASDGTLNKVYSQGESYHIDNNDNFALFNNAEYVIITPEDNIEKIDLNNNYYPEAKVVSAFSHHVPYGTIMDINCARKAFSKITLYVGDHKMDEDSTISEAVAHLLLDSRDVIFFQDQTSQTEQGLGVDIMYQIDLLRYKFHG
ncbi:glycosyltransferase [Erwinia billingiae]|nr:glycosyltransferase [Erwinia billingiae]